MSEQNKLHPIIWVAAISVTLLSLVGMAAIFGIIPRSGTTPEPAAVVASSAPAANVTTPAIETPAAVADKPVEKVVVAPSKPEPQQVKPPVVKKVAAAPKPVPPPGSDVAIPPPGTPYPSPFFPEERTTPPHAAPAPVVAQPAHCLECGVVDNVRAVTVKGQGSGVGAIIGGILGGILANQVGSGTGRDLATIAGAVAGGMAGSEVEKNRQATTQYEVTVRMDDGSSRVISEPVMPQWTIGQSVKVVNGQIQPR